MYQILYQSKSTVKVNSRKYVKYKIISVTQL